MTKRSTKKTNTNNTDQNINSVSRGNMDQINRVASRRRRQTAARFFTYGVMSIATIVGVFICISWAMGYRFDLEKGLSQVALLQFNSFPAGSSVYVNGQRVSGWTPSRSNVETGQVAVTMSRQGYREWKKIINAQPSTVRWLDYVRLVPENVQTDSIYTFSSVDDLLASPDKKTAIALLDSKTGGLGQINASDPTNVIVSTVNLSADTYVDKLSNGEKHGYALVEWDSGSRYVLIEHKYDDDTEYLEYDSRDGDIRNLTRDFGMDVSSPHFSGTNGNVIFVLTGSDLRKIDYDSNTISAPLANNVQSYVLYGNSRIAFVSRIDNNESTKQFVSIYDDGSVEQIKEYDGDETIRVDFSRVNDMDYLVVARGETIAIYPDPLQNISSNPDSASTETAYLSSPGGIDWLDMSGNGRIVMAGLGNKIVSYDIETAENYSFELKRSGKSAWLDDYHLLDIENGSIVMVEFDGQNRENIVSGDLPAFLSNDGRYLFSLDSISGGVVLQRSSMIVS